MKKYQRFKKFFREFTLDMLVYFIIAYVVSYGWRHLEILILGQANPNTVDTIIGIILITSLFLNYLSLRDLRRANKAISEATDSLDMYQEEITKINELLEKRYESHNR